MPYYRLRNILFVLFAVSGFTGLIYESIWSHYLKLFLGHAAYAQALVLTIFMGGMALGAWLASRQVSKWSNLLMGYAIVEGIIGFLGVVFHIVFQFVLDISFDSIIPALDSATKVQLYKWSVATLLILPQSILLGMTFPLMSNGIIRQFPDTPGRSLSMLYFTNSLGAAIGVLVAGFVLIAAVGLPGTILFAGIINILLAIVVYALAKNLVIPLVAKNPVKATSHISLLFICAAFITALASFVYEIAWIRMLSMVLGSSTHSFELMLSAFILGLALGGLFIRKYIDQLTSPILTAGLIQIAMGVCALATVPLYTYTFDLMGFFMAALKPTDEGYRLFTLVSHSIALLIMLPATFCAGMTLPLFTKILLKEGHGEKSIGQIYASNTFGAIVGVIIAIFIAMPVLGLKYTMVLGSGLDVMLGVILLIYSGARLKQPFAYSVTCLIFIIFTASLFINFDFRKMASTVYRTGISQKSSDYSLLFQKDGSTSSIHVISKPDGLITISTNGKPDAAINNYDDDNIGPDEPTMVLVAAIPLAINPDIKTVANIGMGSGLTTHTLLAWPGIERVDTIEIESAMVEGAKFFRPRVERAFSDPRSHIHIEDAKTFFSNNQKKYDLITSEPSNPWVSGVSSLFTEEFYRQIKKYLSEDGMFVQWIHTYEINLKLVLSVLKSLDGHFSNYNLFAINDGDLIILAKNDSPVDIPQDLIFNVDEMRRELSMISVFNLQDIRVRFVANEQLIRPLLNIYTPPTNSDYFPILDLNAPKARFKQENAYELARVRLDPIPFINMMIAEYENPDAANVNKGLLFSTTRKISNAQHIYNYLKSNYYNETDFDPSDIELLISLSRNCSEENDFQLWTQKLIDIAQITIPSLSPGELNELWNSVTPVCAGKLSDVQGHWLTFVKALGLRDATAIADDAIYLLKEGDQQNRERRKILFGSLMLALVNLEEYHAALKLWLQLSDDLFDTDNTPISLLILHGIALQAVNNHTN
jgi:predicted membrane-bound spermidine synthase